MSDTDSASSTPPSDPLPSPEPRWRKIWSAIQQKFPFKTSDQFSAEDKTFGVHFARSRPPLDGGSRSSGLQLLFIIGLLIVATGFAVVFWKKDQIREYIDSLRSDEEVVEVTQKQERAQRVALSASQSTRVNPNNMVSPKVPTTPRANDRNEPTFVAAPEVGEKHGEVRLGAAGEAARTTQQVPQAFSSEAKSATSASSVSSTPTRQVAQASAPATSSARALSQTAAVTVPAPVLPQEEKAKQKSGSDCDCSGRQAASQRVVPSPVATDTYSCSRRSASGKLLHVNCGRGKPIVLPNGDITCQSKNYLPPATEKVCYGVQG